MDERRAEAEALFALLLLQQPRRRATISDQELANGVANIRITRSYNPARMETVFEAKRVSRPRLLEITATTRATEPGQRSAGKARRMTPADYAELPAGRNGGARRPRAYGFDPGVEMLSVVR